MEIIYDFCKGAERVYGSTENIISLKDLTIKLNARKDEIWRSRYNKDLSCIFDLCLDMGHDNPLKEEIQFMRTIELFYPNTFSYRFNGKHIEVLAVIPMRKEYLGIFGRYNGIDNFIRQLRKQLVTVLKYREFPDLTRTKMVENKILATGSINSLTNMYVVDIDTRCSISDIVLGSNNREITNIGLKELNMKFWVREINPDFYKEPQTRSIRKYALIRDIFNKYPKCIINLANERKKGNYGRFLLATYLLNVHNERDAKHQLDIMLNDEERIHMNSGNCKDQWRTILAKGYFSPSCKTMIEAGYAKDLSECKGIGMLED